MALEHPGEAIPLFGAGLALAGDEHRAGDVGGAVQILRAGIDEIDFARGDLALGSFARMVMNHRAIGPGPGNGGEAQAPEMLVLPAEGFEFRRRRNLVEISLRRFPGDPGEEPRQRSTIADMGRRSCREARSRSCRPWAGRKGRRRSRFSPPLRATG